MNQIYIFGNNDDWKIVTSTKGTILHAVRYIDPAKEDEAYIALRAVEGTDANAVNEYLDTRYAYAYTCEKVYAKDRAQATGNVNEVVVNMPGMSSNFAQVYLVMGIPFKVSDQNFDSEEEIMHWVVNSPFEVILWRVRKGTF